MIATIGILILSASLGALVLGLRQRFEADARLIALCLARLDRIDRELAALAAAGGRPECTCPDRGAWRTRPQDHWEDCPRRRAP